MFLKPFLPFAFTGYIDKIYNYYIGFCDLYNNEVNIKYVI